jgi:hypothetical protein
MTERFTFLGAVAMMLQGWTEYDITSAREMWELHH